MAVTNDFAVGNLNAIADKQKKLNRYAVKYTRGPVMLTDITWPTSSAIIYGQTLGDSPLAGGSARTPWGTAVTGIFVWSNSGSILDAGNHTPAVSFLPDQHQRFAAEPAPVALTINKATPTVSAWPARGAITYGQTLGDSVFTGGTASVAGSFAWVSPTTVPDPGTPSYNLRFTPTDTVNYNTVTASLSITVNKATPTIVAWPTANPVDDGQALSTITWATSGSATGITGDPLSGTFGWASPSTVPSSNGNQVARFNPTDSSKYNSVDGNVYVTILYVSLSPWTNRANGQTTEVNLTGVTLHSARIQWRGLAVTGTAENSKANSASGTLTGNLSLNVALPAIDSTYEVFVRHEAYTSHQNYNSQKCNSWPGGGQACNTQSRWDLIFERWTYPLEFERWSTTHMTGSVNHTVYILSSTTTQSYYFQSRTRSRNRLNTTHPSITRSGRTTSLTGELLNNVESAWTNLVDPYQGGAALLTSGVVNTLTHNCSAYSDVYKGPSGQLSFRIEFKYTTG